MNIYSLTLDDLENYFLKNGGKKFNATQVYEWIYKKRINDFEKMTNLNKNMVILLKEKFTITKPKIIKKQSGNGVYKYLFELSDGEKVEAVLMLHDYGQSLCISTEVGCNMNCAFCESGRLKKRRNLTADEMVTQILLVEEDLDIRISHVVLMGIGEPFDNYDNVMKFIRIVNSGKGIDIGARHITVSTCGLVPKIKQFMNEGLQVNLAISLHASNDEIRNRLMPINKVYNIESLIATIKEYIIKTNRRVTFEYILLKNINDSKKCALELSQLLKGLNAYVNLIPYNETSHLEFKKSDKNTILEFYDILKKNKIGVTIRKEFGSEVSAACGQLRANYEEEK